MDTQHRTTVERVSDRELVVARTVNGPARLVFAAWTKPELMKQWWTPRSTGMTMVACEIDARVGGGYRLVFELGGAQMAVFGKYLEVTPPTRLVWTNEEGGEAAVSISTVTFEELEGRTRVVLHELHPTKEALDEVLATQMECGTLETFEQLDGFVAALADEARA